MNKRNYRWNKRNGVNKRAKYFVLKGEHFDNSKVFEKSEILCLHKPVDTQQGGYFTKYFKTEEQRKNRINELIKLGYKEVVRL